MVGLTSVIALVVGPARFATVVARFLPAAEPVWRGLGRHAVPALVTTTVDILYRVSPRERSEIFEEAAVPPAGGAPRSEMLKRLERTEVEAISDARRP